MAQCGRWARHLLFRVIICFSSLLYAWRSCHGTMDMDRTHCQGEARSISITSMGTSALEQSSSMEAGYHAMVFANASAKRVMDPMQRSYVWEWENSIRPNISSQFTPYDLESQSQIEEAYIKYKMSSEKKNVKIRTRGGHEVLICFTGCITTSGEPSDQMCQQAVNQRRIRRRATFDKELLLRVSSFEFLTQSGNWVTMDLTSQAAFRNHFSEYLNFCEMRDPRSPLREARSRVLSANGEFEMLVDFNTMMYQRGRVGEKGRMRDITFRRTPYIDSVDARWQVGAEFPIIPGPLVDRNVNREAGILTRQAILWNGWVSLRPNRMSGSFSHIPLMVRLTRLVKASSTYYTKPGRDTTSVSYNAGRTLSAALYMREAYPDLKVAAVSAASAYQCGGAFMTGGVHALEESLCVQTTLFASIAKIFHQFWGRISAGADERQKYIPDDSVILSPNVEVFRTDGFDGYQYMMRPVTLAAIISVAMYNMNPDVRDAKLDAPKDDSAYSDGVKQKFRSTMAAALEVKADILVMSDVGCGAFKNSPKIIGALFGQVLKEEFWGQFQHVVLVGSKTFARSVGESLDDRRLMVLE